MNAPAYTFGVGSHTLTATATDKAGNTATATTTFTVALTPADLSTLTTQLVQGSAKYKSANILTKLVVTVLVKAVTSIELQLTPKATPAAKAALLKAFAASVQTLVSGGYLTAGQATTLIGLAGPL